MSRRVRRNKQHTILKLICVAALTALVCFGVFYVKRYLESREPEPEVSNIEPVKEEPATFVTPDTGDKKDETEESDEAEETETQEETQTSTKTEEIQTDMKEAAEAASKPKEVARNENGLKVAEPKIWEPYFDSEADAYIIGGDMENILDEEGTCTFVISDGKKTVTKSTDIVRTATWSVCKNLKLAKDELSAGKWTVQLKYKSKYAEGESEKETYTVN